MGLGGRFSREVSLSIFISTLGIFASLAGFYALSEATKERRALEHRTIANDFVGNFESSLNRLSYGLGGVAGMVASTNGELSPTVFQRYSAARTLASEFPGALGFGFISRLQRDELSLLTTKQKLVRGSSFTVYPATQFSDAFVITYLEPEVRNEAAIGYDIGSEANRRRAAELARDSGRPALTQRVQLVQDKNQETGFLYLRAVYRDVAVPVTLAERREKLIGWVYTPFTLERALESVTHQFRERLAFSISDITEPTSPEVLRKKEGGQDETPLIASRVITFGQRRWLVNLYTPLVGAPLTPFDWLPNFTLMLGITLSIASGFMVWFRFTRTRRSLERRLKNGENFVGGILSSAQAAIIVTDTRGIIKVFNTYASELLGYPPKEVINCKSLPHFHLPSEIADYSNLRSEDPHGSNISHFDALIAKARQDIPDEREWTFVTKQGERVPVRMTVTAIRDMDGEIIEYMGLAINITEQKKASQEIAMNQRLLRQFVEYSPAAVAMFDDRLNYLVVSGRWYTDYKLEGENIIGRCHYDVFPDLPQVYKDAHQQILTGEKEVLSAEDCFTRSTGEEVWIKWELQPWRNQENEIAGLIMLTEVVTQRKLEEQAFFEAHKQTVAAKRQLRESLDLLESTNRKLAQATEFKSKFLASMTHEIRSPLTSIIGFSESLQIDSLSEIDRLQATAAIVRNSRHLLDVVNDVLDISKIEAGKIDITLAPIDVEEMLTSLSEMMRQRAAEKDLFLLFELVPSIPRIIKSDDLRLRQILINLIGNAIKFTDTGGISVKVAYNQHQNSLTFSVKDTGYGIPEENQKKLFSPYAQSDSSIVRAFGGTGLGLTISRELAERLGGTLELSYSSPEGSTFLLTIATNIETDAAAIEELLMVGRGDPKSPATDTKTLLLNSPPLSTSHQHIGGRVLVAEDAPDNQLLISSLLRRTGVDFRMVENGAKALEALADEQFDLVLMDCQMPVLDGYSTVKKIRELGITIPVIALTANSLQSEKDLAFQSGFSGFLLKPFSRKALFEALEASLN